MPFCHSPTVLWSYEVALIWFEATKYNITAVLPKNMVH